MLDTPEQIISDEERTLLEELLNIEEEKNSRVLFIEISLL
jgi:hypothetical protein